ncbi:hypothetical protein GCM10018980_72310 [Streptomyces capoamus]|uniref:Transposase n=1 Tax=Streptomyces capoamus TaxID=68183 RepID=A0A919KFY3_9ACTN|nr:hypothetical protein GCM10010501_16950 [Streptomyces libani subsp. rufus]GHG75044.1 hypothetical protein GCM10018980_72310 [Streptomyces capoamus]
MRLSLAYFRRCLARSARPNRVSEAVREVVKTTGVLGGKHRRALDATMLDDAVATQDTVTQLIAAVRAVIREVPAPCRRRRGRAVHRARLHRSRQTPQRGAEGRNEPADHARGRSRGGLSAKIHLVADGRASSWLGRHRGPGR